MLIERSFLAVIPARGGSKAVPRKNIRMMGGHPLLLHTLRQVAQVPQIDCSVVSTDDQEIAEITAAAGGRVVRRPAELSTDSAPTEWALLHAIEVFEQAGQTFDYVIVLEPTSPFRSPKTILNCMTAIVDNDAPSLMTVVETRSNLGRLKDGRFSPLTPNAPRRRQDREPFYIESSTVYICRTEHLKATKSLVVPDWLAVSVPEAEAFDINTELDFAVADSIMNRLSPSSSDS